MKIYLSSTYRDLREHRAAVDRALRRMGHDVIGMEQYVAEGGRPLERCIADVKAADLYLVILAWRYGYRPVEKGNPSSLSITELELKAAVDKPVLAFLLDPQAAWPPSEMDALSANPMDAADILRLRGEVGSSYLAGIFRTPDDLASQVAAAVAIQGLGNRLVDRLLAATSVGAEGMGQFGRGSPLQDSTIMAIKDMVRGAGTVTSMIIDLGDGDQWWSTRLFLLASLLKALTDVRQLVFQDRDGGFAGMASPAALLDGLAATFPDLDQFRRGSTHPLPAMTMPSQDTEREIDRQTLIWNNTVAGMEPSVKVGVRPQLLREWLGERLITRCIQVDAASPTMVQVQQIVESLLRDVPIERPGSSVPPKPVLQVVDRDAFALELAREWVRTGLPRTPVRPSGLA